MTTRRTRAVVIPGLVSRWPCVAAACGSDEGSSSDSSPAEESEAATPTDTEAAGESAGAAGAVDTIGFIYVGPKDDFGYNQAAYEGSVAERGFVPTSKCSRQRTFPKPLKPKPSCRT